MRLKKTVLDSGISKISNAITCCAQSVEMSWTTQKYLVIIYIYKEKKRCYILLVLLHVPIKACKLVQVIAS
jgi:hypothetical protein